MKAKIFITLLSILCLFSASCCNNGGKWIQGYWKSDNNYEYLFVKGNKIYRIFPDNRKKNIDFSAVKALFEEQQEIEPWCIYDIGKLNGTTEIGIKSIKKIKSLGEYIDESEWQEITSYLEDNTSDLSSNAFKFLSSVQEGASQNTFFIEEKEKALFSIECDFDYGFSYGLTRYSKIEPSGKKNKQSPEEISEESWHNLFDENNIAVFDIGLTDKFGIWDNQYYLFFHAYSYSDGMTEGTATLCNYSTSTHSTVVSMGENMRFNYVFKNGVVILTGAEWYELIRKNWHKLNIHEIPFTFNTTEHSLSGRYWFRNNQSYMITAKPIDFDYSYWINRVRF